MRGATRPCRDEPIVVSLETLVPKGYFYRRLKAQLDLSFVRDWARVWHADRRHREQSAS
jgi:hypothetical protein